MLSLLSTSVLGAAQEGLSHQALHSFALNHNVAGDYAAASEKHALALDKATAHFAKQTHRWTPKTLGGEDKSSLMNTAYTGVATHPDGPSAVLYTNTMDSRYNKEGVYLPPKKFVYSPGRSRACCVQKCGANKDCAIGCKMWMGASSLNWESKTWHTKLRNKCDRDVAAAKTAEAHAIRVRTGVDAASSDITTRNPELAKGHPKFQSYFKTLGLEPDSVADAKTGCDNYLTCMYALESTPVTALAKDTESRVTLDLDGNRDGVGGEKHFRSTEAHATAAPAPVVPVKK
jgi:hypothetical protein